jgi:hypothetical protein
MFTQINNFYFSMKDLAFPNSDGTKVTILNLENENVFTGEVLLSNDRIPLIIFNDKNEICVFISCDAWSSKNNYHYVSFTTYKSRSWIYSLIEKFSECVYNTNSVLDLASSEFEKIKDSFQFTQVDDSSIPSAPNTSSFRASVSGKINLLSNVTSYGEYNSKTFLHKSFQIGSGIDRKQSNLIVAVSSVISILASARLEKSSRHYKDGTNFTTVGISGY